MIRAAILAGAMFAACVAARAQTNASANPQSPPAPNTSAQTEPSSPALPSGPAVTVELNGTVDSRKVKAGDKVEAHTIEALKNGNDIVIPNGTKLVGHVTQASARARGDNDSSLAIQFDEAVPKKEQAIPLHVMIMAVAAPAQPNSANDFPTAGSDPLAGTVAETQTSPMGASRPAHPNITDRPAPGIPDSLDSAPAGSLVRGPLPAKSRGVYGLSGLKLVWEDSNGNPATVITSTRQNVRLEGGTRLLLVAEPTAASTAGK